MYKDILLIIIALATCGIWYELRYGIAKRREIEKKRQRNSNQLRTESKAKWDTFTEGRK